MGARESKTNDPDSKSGSNSTKDELIGILLDGILLYGFYVTAKYAFKSLKPMIDELRSTENSRSKLQHRLTRSGRPLFRTTYYEEIIANDIVDPQDIDVCFDDIGGLEQQKRDIFDLVVLPIKCPQFFSSRGKLLSAPKGILLYGKPGTGKTMLAKAIARESGAFFIDLKISTIMSKWFGESQKLVRAAFSLALKLAPCIIFIDEVDSFMGSRSGGSDPTFASMKTEFLALWDGFMDMSYDDRGYGVIVLGATNRPQDVDPAFLRRMPRTFEIGLPDQSQREKILRLQLRNEEIKSDFDFVELSRTTQNYSGSDLKELCRAALMIPLREHLETIREDTYTCAAEVHPNIRPLSMTDIEEAITMVQPTGATAYAYEENQNRKEVAPPSYLRINSDIFDAIVTSGLQRMMQLPRNDN